MSLDSVETSTVDVLEFGLKVESHLLIVDADEQHDWLGGGQPSDGMGWQSSWLKN